MSDPIKSRTIAEIYAGAKKARDALIVDLQWQFEELSRRRDIRQKLALIKAAEDWLNSVPHDLYGRLGDDLVISFNDELLINGRGKFCIHVKELDIAEPLNPNELEHLQILEKVDIDELALYIANLMHALGIDDPTFV